MALQVTRMLVPASKFKFKCPYKMVPEGICVHNTYNKASAMAEVSYMIRNNNYVSYHAAVDDYRVVEAIPENRNAFHAGDGKNGKGNRRYYSVEICYSTGSAEQFTKAENNAAYYIACKLKEHGWGIDKVKKHQDFSGKYCPHKTLDLGWQRFLNKIRQYLGKSPVVTPDNRPFGKLEVDGSHGPATTRRKQQHYGTEQDGIISGQPVANKKYCYALKVGGCVDWMDNDEAYGSQMLKAEQRSLKAEGYYKGEIDGFQGPKHNEAKQRFLKDKGFYKGAIDKSYGPETCKADQMWLNSLL